MDRPNTPGSHIDWAGEDDDSLPDLDDWGVKSVTDKSTSSVSADQPDLISPILVDALKPLPNIEAGSPLVVSSAAPPPEDKPKADEPPPASSASVKGAVGDNTPRGAPTVTPSKAGTQTKEKPPAQKPQVPSKDRRKSDASSKAPAAAAPAVEKESTVKKSPLKQSNVPLHPSLPPKPVDAIDALSKRVPRKPNIPPVQAPGATADIEPPLKSGLSESMHAPKPNSVDSQEQADNTSPSPEPQGVAGSMHAPIQSAPSHITTHSTPNSSFQPSHGRAHTIGRPGAIRIPFSPSHGQFPDGAADERAARRDRINHARTHSSPPTGPGTHTAHSRTVHASRPVITVDALSRLARTLGGSPGPKRESAAAAKE